MLPNLSALRLSADNDHEADTGAELYGQDYIMLFPEDLFDGAVGPHMEFFVERFGWRDRMKWITEYGLGGRTIGIIVHEPNNGKLGDKASIEIFRLLGYKKMDIRKYIITLGDVKSVCDAFLRHASVLGDFAHGLFDGAPWETTSHPGSDQFLILKELAKNAKTIELTKDRETAIKVLQGSSYRCFRDAVEMLQNDKRPEDPEYKCDLKTFARWETLVRSMKEMMVTELFDFYVVSVAEDFIPAGELASPFQLQRFLATTINPKMLDDLQQFANKDQPHTVLAIKVKAGARFMPMFSLGSSQAQEYEIVLDSGQTATPLKVEDTHDCSHYGGPGICRIVWLEVG